MADRDIALLDAPNSIPGAATFNAVARRLKFISSESIDISVSKDGGLVLEVMGGGGGSLPLEVSAPLKLELDEQTGMPRLSLDFSDFADGVLAVQNGQLTTIATSTCDNA